MGVWVNVGARDETPAENGLCHFIEHMIFKGTRKRTAYQIAKEFDAIGGQSNAFTTMENTCYHARVMDSHLNTMVDILSDIFLNSVFDQSEVDRERPVLFQEIGMVEDSPEEQIHILSGKTYWGESALGQSIIGTRENILRFDSATIVDFFQRFYQPSRIVISAAGNIEHDRLTELVYRQFESIPTGNSLPERQTPSGSVGMDLHAKELEQTHICIGTKGLKITDPKRFAFSLLNTMLGGNMSSRLFQQIREKRGLAYSVYSFISPYVDTGMFGAYAGVDPQNARETITVLLDQMMNLKANPLEAGELQDAKEYTKGSLLLAAESTDNQMVRLAQNEIHFSRYVPLQEILDQIDAVTSEEILALAEELFQPGQFAVTVLGPISDPKDFNALLG